VWVQARLKAADGVDFRHAVAVPGESSAMLCVEPATAAEPLAAHEHTQASASHHVQAEALTGETLRRQRFLDQLAAQGGNVSQAARQLGVSRGTLYRRLRGWREEDKVAPAGLR
jgi:DNA-binding NtrC family response regulator